jgi:hypothetical protein
MMVASAQVDTKSVVPLGTIAAYLAFLLFLVLFQTFWEHVVSSKDIDVLNLLAPILFGIGNLLLAWKLVQQSPLAIWNPLFWLLLACTLYYGLGQLIHLFGHPDSVARVNSLYFVDPSGLARTNFLHTIGVMIIVGAYLSASGLLELGKRGHVSDLGKPVDELRSVREGQAAALLFLCIGVPIKYFFELPYNLGLLKWTLPGSIQHLGTLSGVALIPLYWLYRKRGGIYASLFFTLVTTECLASLTTLSKQKMIETALFVILGSQLVRPSVKKLVFSGVLVVAAFILFINPFVTFARVAVDRDWAAAKDLSQVLDLVGKYKERKEAVRDVQFPDAQLWWTRLAYSNVELFAIRQYDRGRPGTTFHLTPYTLIPRFIMPEKPWMNSGLEFTYLISGDRTMRSATGLGALGEGYWNAGWLGVVVVGIVIGVLLAAFHRISRRILEAHNFMFLPVTVASIILGYRIDDWFVATYLGTTVEVALMYLAIQYFARPMLVGTPTSPESAVRDEVMASGSATRQFPLLR